MAQLSEFERSYAHVLLYPPQPRAMQEPEGFASNFSTRMYGIYLQEKRTEVASGQPVSESFLRWHRGREYDGTAGTCKYRVGTFRRIQAPGERSINPLPQRAPKCLVMLFSFIYFY